MATKTDVTAPTDEPAATPTTTHIIEPRAQDATHEAAQETTQEVAQEATITATHPHPPGNALGEGPIFDKRLFRHLVSYMIRGFFAKRQRDVGSTRASVELNAYEALETATKEFAIGYFRWKSIWLTQVAAHQAGGRRVEAQDREFAIAAGVLLAPWAWFLWRGIE